jgi:hypothetical protein
MELNGIVITLARWSLSVFGERIAAAVAWERVKNG